jgi:hypothetical protein
MNAPSHSLDKFRVQEQKKQSTLEWVAFFDADLAPTNFANP